MAVEAVIFDKDGVLKLHGVYGQDLKDARDGSKTLTDSGKLVSICTGQSCKESEDVISAAKPNGVCAYEMGAVMVTPDGREISLIEEEPSLRIRFNGALSALELWRDELDSKMPELRERAETCGIKGLRRLTDKKKIVSYVFAEGSGERLFEFFMRHVIEETEKGYDVRRFLNSGSLRVMVPPYAVDFLPAIGKHYAARGIMKHEKLKPERVCVVCDESHCDLDMIETVYERGYAACPENADVSVQAYVRLFGSKGYISPYKCEEGAVVDITRHILKRWS
jgi:hydroxymethylpyrimidine pyrophosphatase-like HAD family hydrolase